MSVAYVDQHTLWHSDTACK